MIFPGTLNVIIGVIMAAVGGSIAFIEYRTSTKKLAGEFQQ